MLGSPTRQWYTESILDHVAKQIGEENLNIPDDGILTLRIAVFEDFVNRLELRQNMKHYVSETGSVSVFR
jgi:hypothetical protein